MKNTLIALAVAASTVSGAAHAWSTGDIDSSFNINGSITAEQYGDKWEWMVGDGLSFENTTNDMTENRTVLTISQNKPTPILLGRTKEAFATSVAGVGAIPLISFSDYERNKVTLEASGEDNKGFFNLPMTDNEGNKLGNVKVNVTAVGLLAYSELKTKLIGVASVISNDSSKIYNGGLVSSVGKSGQFASGLVAKFGNYNHNTLATQIKTVHPGLGSLISQSVAKSTDMVNTDSDVMASSYALGIDQGQTIVATFDAPVVKTTQWAAPLNVSVTYN